MTSHHLPAFQCPHCGAKLGAVTNADGDTALPDIGDASICLHCAGVMVFGDNLIPHAINELELDEMSEHTKRVLARGQRLVLQFIARKGDKHG